MNQPLIIRSVQEQDLPAILEIAEQTGFGFTSLPNDKLTLTEKISRSIKSFSEKLDAKNRSYFFVMENLKTKEIAGTATIEAFVGDPWPIYHYKLSTLFQVSQALNKIKEHQILQLMSDYTGATELGALFLKSAYRGEGRGEFLSRARCLFIAEFPDLFSDLLIAEMRGITNKEGVSSFWDALGRHFFDISFREADYLRSVQGRQFIAELMPTHPIYIDILPEMAIQAIGKTHEKSTPAMHILKKEGFQFRNIVDIFDAGPIIEAHKRELKTVRESSVAILAECRPKLSEGPFLLLGNTNLHFRATLGKMEFTTNGDIILETETAKSLNAEIGSHIRFCAWR